MERSRRPEKRAEYEAALFVPPMPKAAAYLWNAYLRLRRHKGGNGFGIAPIEWPDIDAFCRHARLNLAPWEIEMIEVIDDAFVAAQADDSDKEGDG